MQGPHSEFHPACERTLMICALPRSGSNLLCELIESTRRLGNPDEWLNQDRNRWNCGRFGLPPDTRIDAMIHKLQEETSTFNGVFSHKILMYSFTYLMESLREIPGNKRLDDRQLLGAYFPGLQLIYIKREDKLAQAISLLKAMQSAIWHNNARTREQADPIHFSWTAIHNLITDLEQQESQWERFIRKSGLPSMPVIYEDLIRDKRGVLNTVLSFTGVECELAEKEEVEVRHKRTRDETNRKWREQYLAIEERMKVSPSRGWFPWPSHKAEISVDVSRIEAEVGKAFSLSVRLRNSGKRAWPGYGRKDGKGWIKLAAQIVNSEGHVLSGSDSWRELPREVAPGEELEMTIVENAPEKPGTYRVWIDLVSTPEAWFDKSSGCGVELELEVLKDDKLQFLDRYFGHYTEDKDGEIFQVPWFGLFHLNDFPGLYHFGLGQLSCGGAGIESDEFIFESSFHGTLKTSSSEFPVMWSDKYAAKIKWHVGSHAPPRLSILKSGEWEPLNFKESSSCLEEAADYFGAEPDSKGILTLSWMGQLDVTEYPKIKHEILGIVWCSGPGAKEDSFFFNNPRIGWFWTNSTSYPKLCNMDSKEWVAAEEIGASIF